MLQQQKGGLNLFVYLFVIGICTGFSTQWTVSNTACTLTDAFPQEHREPRFLESSVPALRPQAAS